MLNQFFVLNEMVKSRIVAVIRAENFEIAKKIAQSCADGGIKFIEITFTVPDADLVIGELVKFYKGNENIFIGAGTVIDSETARIAILRGAKYIVGPTFSENIAKMCNRYQIPYIPGCATPNEILMAFEAGCSVVKLFPGSLCDYNFIKNIKGPFPQGTYMVSGGVNLENVEEWFKAGYDIVSIGSELTKSAKNNDFETITKLSKILVDKVGR